MQRGGFIGMGATLAAAFSQVEVFAGASHDPNDDKSNAQIDFINDGISNNDQINHSKQLNGRQFPAAAVEERGDRFISYK